MQQDVVPHLPLWALYLQAFGTIGAAIVAAGIASVIQYRQWMVARDKLRLELFEKRATVVSALDHSLWRSGPKADSEASRNAVQERLNLIVGYRFLFDEDVCAYISKAEDALLSMSMTCMAVSDAYIDESQRKWDRAEKVFDECRHAVRGATKHIMTFVN